MNTVQGGGCGAYGLNRPSTVSSHGGIESIRSSIRVNRSAAVTSHSGTIDESYRHRWSIVRHCIDAGFSFFHPDAPQFYHLAQIGKVCGKLWPEL